MTQPTALITGITGQDGSYLANFLLSQGYRMVGIKSCMGGSGIADATHAAPQFQPRPRRERGATARELSDGTPTARSTNLKN